MHRVRYIILFLAVSFCEQMLAQGGVMSFLKKVGTKLDSMAIKGVDRNYIDAPEHPWQVILRGNISQTIVSMSTEGSIAGASYSAKPHLKTTPSQYVGLWVGYRGYGLGYTVNVAGDKGSYLTFGATGGAYGVNVRIHSFANRNPNFNLNSGAIPEEKKDLWYEVQLSEPIHVKTVFADGYYLFNGKKFSYSAAYDQSAIQKRSAGSLMAGLMYNYIRIDYATDANGDLVYLMNGLGKVKLWQASAGVGYAFNWVPVRGVLVNIMAMPMLTFVNKLKVFRYHTNMEELMQDPYFWDPTVSDAEWDAWLYSHLRVTPESEMKYNSGLSLGFDGRVSLTYNFGRYFINAYGQFNNIRYRHDRSNGYVNDWFVNTSVGIRL